MMLYYRLPLLLLLIVAWPAEGMSQNLGQDREALMDGLIRSCEKGHEFSRTQKKAIRDEYGEDAAERAFRYSRVKEKIAEGLGLNPNILNPPESGHCRGGFSLRALEFDKAYEFPPAKPVAQWRATQLRLNPDGQHSVVFQGVGHVALMATSSNAETRFHAKEILEAIRHDFSAERPDVVIVEGISTGSGFSPCESSLESLLRAGGMPIDETSLGIQLALENGLPFVGGEPSVEREVAIAKDHGLVGSMRYRYPSYGEGDIKTFKKFESMAQYFAALPPGKPASLDEGLRYALEEQAAPSPLGFALEKKRLLSWFRKWEKKNLEREPMRGLYAKFLTPRLPPRGISGLFAFEVELRDAHLRQLIENLSAANKHVLVIYGGSHLDTNKGALTEWAKAPRVVCAPHHELHAGTDDSLSPTDDVPSTKSAE